IVVSEPGFRSSKGKCVQESTVRGQSE
ncbi:hypothetical protein A2U01_0089089, partial [Trifolium medium]|nr:hypothetical protein [Trifolium medium]